MQKPKQPRNTFKRKFLMENYFDVSKILGRGKNLQHPETPCAGAPVERHTCTTDKCAQLLPFFLTIHITIHLNIHHVLSRALIHFVNTIIFLLSRLISYMPHHITIFI